MSPKLTETPMQWVLSSMKKNYSLWPVVAFAFGVAPAFVLIQTYHACKGPDVRFTRDFEPWNKFDNKKYKYISSEDYKNYSHPRPRFE